jgi:hypothetical protein
MMLQMKQQTMQALARRRPHPATTRARAPVTIARTATEAASAASANAAPRRRRPHPATPRALAPVSSTIPRAATEAAATSAAAPRADAGDLWEELRLSVEAYGKAPPSQKLAYSSDVLDALKALKSAGEAPAWGSVFGAAPADGPAEDANASERQLYARRGVMPGELRQAGIKQPDAIARPSVRNDAAFLTTVVGVTSVMAIALGQLPGQWGFWGTYLSGGIAIVVLAVGSTAPGLLQAIIDRFSQAFPDYRQRVIDHEAAHVLVAHLAGVPVVSYSLAIGQEHTALAEARLGRRLIEGKLSAADIDALAPVAVAGAAAEGQRYEEVMGQTADLLDLQRILLRSEDRLTDAQQQSVTRWAVWCAATALKRHARAYDAVRQAMADGLPADGVVRAIERAEAEARAEEAERRG